MLPKKSKSHKSIVCVVNVTGIFKIVSWELTLETGGKALS
jgi:hypothetical protein